MRKLVWIAALASAAAIASNAATYTLTLKQAVEQGLTKNPDVTLARLDQLKAVQDIRSAQDPFYLHAGVGSGIAYTNGFPLSIEGSAPSIIQAKASEYLFNQPQRYTVQAARENARGAGFTAAQKGDDIAWQIAGLFLDADRSSRLLDTAKNQLDSLQKVLDTIQSRVEAGRELPIDVRQAKFNLTSARVRLSNFEADRDLAERNLAIALGYDAGDTVVPAPAGRAVPAMPATEAEAIQSALASSSEVKRLESAMIAKGLEVKSVEAKRLPQVDLVAQYALFGKYNDLNQYFARFQRNNGEIGASIQMPLFLGSGVKAAVASLTTDQEHLRVEMKSAKDRIAMSVHQSYAGLDRAKLAGDLAKEGLDLAREQLTVVLDQMNDGRATLREVEQARINESEKWIAFYDAQFTQERARLDVLRQTGSLLAAIR